LLKSARLVHVCVCVCVCACVCVCVCVCVFVCVCARNHSIGWRAALAHAGFGDGSSSQLQVGYVSLSPSLSVGRIWIGRSEEVKGRVRWRAMTGLVTMKMGSLSLW
jgi:hypothetical protein